MSEDRAAFNLPADLAGLTTEELAALRDQAVAEFDTLYSAEGPRSAADVARATELAAAIDSLDAETAGRVENAAAFDALHGRVHPPQLDADGDDTGDSEDGDSADSGDLDAAQAEPVVADAQTRPAGGARTAPRDLGGVGGPTMRLNPSLSGAQRNAPAPRVPNRTDDDLIVTAAAATSGMPIGAKFTDLGAVTQAFIAQARGLPTTHGRPNAVPVVTVRNRFAHVIDERMSVDQMQEILRQASDQSVLVAAGGWCAPSETRYDFFNVACADGMLDLPTTGVTRGGIRFPVSPSLADVFSSPTGLVPFQADPSASTEPWIWTEGDDILAVTGAGTKPCIRVPCPSFDEVRLECYGICLTAGNLTDNAYPESTRNFLALLMNAHEHTMNWRYISQLVTLSTLSTPSSGFGCTGAGTTAPLLGAIDMAAIDYRTKYGMCENDVLEVVLPIWAKGMVRSDLAKRTGVSDLFAVTDAQIAAWLDARGVRAQFVQDYQVRAAGQPGRADAMSTWPSTVEFMIYAAGTYVRGNGMSLDLGVVRDSTLNETNDHTAAWSEECHLIAQIGHEGRRYVVQVCADGTTGAADLTGCCL